MGALRSGRIVWRTLRAAITAADATHPNTLAPTDALSIGAKQRGRYGWVRLTNGVTVVDPSLTVTVYGKRGTTWEVITQLNGGTAIVPTTGQPFGETNRVNHAYRIEGLGAWDAIWASVTGTFGDDGGAPLPGTVTVQLGFET